MATDEGDKIPDEKHELEPEGSGKAAGRSRDVDDSATVQHSLVGETPPAKDNVTEARHDSDDCGTAAVADCVIKHRSSDQQRELTEPAVCAAEEENLSIGLVDDARLQQQIATGEEDGRSSDGRLSLQHAVNPEEGDSGHDDDQLSLDGATQCQEGDINDYDLSASESISISPVSSSDDDNDDEGGSLSRFKVGDSDDGARADVSESDSEKDESNRKTANWNICITSVMPTDTLAAQTEDTEWHYHREPCYPMRVHASLHPRLLSSVVPEDEDLSRQEVEQLTLKLEDLTSERHPHSGQHESARIGNRQTRMKYTDKFESHQEQLKIIENLQYCHDLIRHKFENSIRRKKNYRRLLERYDAAIFKAMKGKKDVAQLRLLPSLGFSTTENTTSQCPCCDRLFHSQRALQIHLKECIDRTWISLMSYKVMFRSDQPS